MLPLEALSRVVQGVDPLPGSNHIPVKKELKMATHKFTPPDLALVQPGQVVTFEKAADLGDTLSLFIAGVLAIHSMGGYVRVSGTAIDTSTLAGAKVLEVLQAVQQFEAGVSLAQ